MERGAEEIRTLLARANLLKMRQQWDESALLCAEILQRDTQSAPAHALLGEINEARGRLDAALHCYGMAVDLAPENLVWRERLQRVVRQKQAALQSSQKAVPVADPPARAGREKTLDWLDRRFPPGQPKSILYLVVSFGAVLALMMGIGAGLLLTGRKDDRLRVIPSPPAATPRPQLVQVAAPSPLPSPQELPQRAAAPDARPTTNGTSATTQPLNVPGAQQALLDPATGRVQLEIVVAPAGKSVAEAREQILRQAVLVARAALSAAPTAQQLQITVGLQGAAGPAPGLVADAVPAGLAAVSEPETADAATLAGAFSHLEWAPHLSNDTPSLAP